MARGDILGITIRSADLNGARVNGAIADVTFEGMAIGGIGDASKISFTVQTPGFDANGNAITRTRILTGLVALRRPIYPQWSSGGSFPAATRAFMAGGTATDARVTNTGGRIYASAGGTAGTTMPNHTSGTVSDGQLAWTYVGSVGDFANQIAGWIEAEQRPSGSNVVVSYVLSGYVHGVDQIIAVNVAAGLYSQAGLSAQTSDLGLVTNASTRAYTTPLGHWVSAGWQQFDGDPWIEVYGTHYYAMGGRTLACVKFNVRDQAGNLIATYQTNSMTRSRVATRGNALPVYGVSMPGLPDGFYTVDFEFYPWIGNVTFRSAAPASATNKTGFGALPGSFTANTTLHYNTPAALPFYRGASGAYARVFAYVDPAGAGATPTVSLDPAIARLPANRFATILAAATAIQTFNNSRGHNDLAAGVVRPMAGAHVAQLGGSLQALNRGLTALVVEADPEAAPFAVEIHYSATAANRASARRVHYRNIRMVNSTNAPIWNAGTDGAVAWGTGFVNEIEFDNVDWSGITGAALASNIVTSNGLVGFTNCIFPAFTAAIGNSNTRQCIRAFWGCTMAAPGGEFRGISFGGSVLNGSSRPASPNTGFLQDPVDGVNPTFRRIDTFGIVACTSPAQTSQPKIPSQLTITWASGCYVEQALFEVLNGGISKGIELSADGTTSAGATQGTAPNTIFRAITIAGEGANFLYNENGFVNVFKEGVVAHVAEDDHNCKADFYNSGADVANPNRVGNFMVRMGVEHKGLVIFAATDGSPSPKNLSGEVLQPDSIWGTGLAPLTRDWANDRSVSGNNLGYGDYTPGRHSATIGRVRDGEHVFPFDIYGRPRLCGAFAAAGAAASRRENLRVAALLGCGN